MDESQSSEEEVLHHLKWENRMLQQRVFELEEKLQRVEPPSVKREHDSSVTKLLRAKDERLEKLAAQMEQKRTELEADIQELDRKNAILALEVTALRLYHELMDVEPSALIAVNRDGKIALFNPAARKMMGEAAHAALHQPIEKVDFAALDPSIPALVRTALGNRQPQNRSWRARDRQVATTVHPLGTEKDPAGALVRITVTPA
jgi:PAS domain-containing protein